MNYEMGEASSTQHVWDRGEMYTWFWREILREGYKLDVKGVDGKMIY
jgi:hypothetical protein